MQEEDCGHAPFSGGRSMKISIPVALILAALPGVRAQEDPTVFRSDVRLVRVDAQVVDASNKTIPDLRAGDFRLVENGRPRQIKNFLAEDMPVDVLLLLDVSGSMRPNLEILERASSEALRVLAPGDRVAIMTFNRGTRIRLAFRENKQEVQAALSALLFNERFNGGTDIYRGMMDAVEYVEKNARADARRAIIIVTDDQTELHRDDAAVIASLAEADTVLSALLAPNAMRNGSRYPSGGGGGGGIYIPSIPDILIGGRRSRFPGGGQRYPGGGGGSGTHPGGTPEIAEASGGDAMGVGTAYAFRDTLARIRQRYALHFNLPPTAAPSELRRVTVELTETARRRYPDAQIRYRRTYRTPSTLQQPSPGAKDEEEVIAESVELTQAEQARAEAAAANRPRATPSRQGRVVIDETERIRGPLPAMRESSTSAGGSSTARPAADSGPKPVWRAATEADKAEAEQVEKAAATATGSKKQ
jgi:VWFA-related protein